jgi:cysteine desulfurase
MRPIYLDYAATTPVDPRVIEKMCFYLGADGIFANPSSNHVLGHVARQAVEVAREQVAALIKAEPSEIFWTSGATEANNLAIKGVAELYQRKGKHIVTLRTEHKTVLDPCQFLEKQGFSLTYLSPEPTGVVDLEKFRAALREDTILVSIMYVNNELGVIQDLQALAQLTAARGILLHVDAAQAVGKLPLDVTALPLDLLSLCAHKVYGPKGIGALYLRRKPRVRVAVQMHGGGQEQGLRSGTLPTHQIVGMGEAFALAKQDMPADNHRIRACREQFLQGLQALPHVLHGDSQHAVPHILNFRLGDLPAREMLRAMPDLAVSTASACMQASHSSPVLRALGLSESQAKGALRFSFGRFTTPAEIAFAVEQLHRAVNTLR